MTEEEKKAIEDLKLTIEQEKEELPYSKESLKNNETLLNLIEKLQKENEGKDKKILGRKFYEVDLNELLKENYIPKDKIREKITYLIGENEIADMPKECYRRNEYVIEILIELLEEE